jgi:UMF1 family MFS transporter
MRSDSEEERLVVDDALFDETTGRMRRGYGGLVSSSDEDAMQDAVMPGEGGMSRKRRPGASPATPTEGSTKGYSARRLVGDPQALEATSSTLCNSFLWFAYDIADSWWGMSLGYLGYVPYCLLIGKVDRGWSYEFSISVALWALSVSNLVVAVLSPVLGALSDVVGNRKLAVILSALLAFAGMLALPFVRDIWWVCSCFAFSNIFMQLARLFYDSQIPFVVELKRRSFVQALGSALGVLGSLFAVCWSLVAKELFGTWTALSDPRTIASSASSSSSSSEGITFGGLRQFLIGSAIGYFVICLPYAFHSEKHGQRSEPIMDCLKRSLREIRETFLDIVGDRNSLCFTVGLFLVMDNFFNSQILGASTLQGAAGFSAWTTDIVLIAVIPVTFVTAIAGGVITHYFGCVLGFVVCIVSFLFSELALFLANWHVDGTVITWKIGLTSIASNGIAVGFLTVTGRFFIVELAQPSRVAQWGGFQRVLSQAGSVFSPLIYAGILSLAAKQGATLNMAYRFVFLYRIILFVVALTFVLFIVDPHRRYMRGERMPYKNIYAAARCCPTINANDPAVIEDVSDDQPTGTTTP